MVIAQHLIFTAYGFWLPNDPRGSWSDFVRSWELLPAGGPATKVDTRRSVAGRPHGRALRERQKDVLQYDPVSFTPEQVAAVARGYAAAVAESGYRVPACSIQPGHTHLVVERHANPGERIIGHLKARATQRLLAERLLAERLHPFRDTRTAAGTVPPTWASRGWKVFPDTDAAVDRAVRYVEDNPAKAGLPRQTWDFVGV